MPMTFCRNLSMLNCDVTISMDVCQFRFVSFVHFFFRNCTDGDIIETVWCFLFFATLCHVVVAAMVVEETTMGRLM